MKKYFFYLFVIVLITSCTKGSKFEIAGEVTNAADSILYLETSHLHKSTVIDSVKLKASGKFVFQSPRNNHPEFYRLRLGKSVINLAIDSTERISVKASKDNFANGYEISGSDNNVKIKQIAMLSSGLKQEIDALNKKWNAKEIDSSAYKAVVLDGVKRYKEGTKEIIFGNPKSTAAYFALYQTVNNMTIYDIYDKSDYSYFAAVANQFHENYPEWNRATNLYNNTLYALKMRKNQVAAKNAPIDSISYFDIALPNLNGRIRKLSEIVGKKVILIDFTTYQDAYSPKHNRSLAELYRKYAPAGFEIYQVSVDPDENGWKVAAENIPWIAVRDPKHVYSEYAKLYNIQKMPTFFLMNRKGEIVKRDADIKNLEEEIKKLL